VSLELFGMGIAPRHHRSGLGDTRMGLLQPDPVLGRQAVQPLDPCSSSLASVSKMMAFGCTLVSTVTRLRSWPRNAPTSCVASGDPVKYSAHRPFADPKRSTSTVEPVQAGRIPVGKARQTHIIAQHGIHDDIVGAMGAIEQQLARSAGRSNFSLRCTYNCVRKVTPSGELFASHKSFEIGIDRSMFELSTRI